MCYLIAKTKVSGSNPIQPIFFFGRKKPFSETHFCFRFFYRIILFWIISLFFIYFFYFLYFIRFAIFYSFHFGRYITNQRNLVALLSESLDRPRSRSFLGKGQLAPVFCRQQCRFTSIAVKYQGRDACSFPTRVLL